MIFLRTTWLWPGDNTTSPSMLLIEFWQERALREQLNSDGRNVNYVSGKKTLVMEINCWKYPFQIYSMHQGNRSREASQRSEALSGIYNKVNSWGKRLMEWEPSSNDGSEFQDPDPANLHFESSPLIFPYTHTISRLRHRINPFLSLRQSISSSPIGRELVLEESGV